MGNLSNGDLLEIRKSGDASAIAKLSRDDLLRLAGMSDPSKTVNPDEFLQHLKGNDKKGAKEAYKALVAGLSASQAFVPKGRFLSIKMDSRGVIECARKTISRRLNEGDKTETHDFYTRTIKNGKVKEFEVVKTIAM